MNVTSSSPSAQRNSTLAATAKSDKPAYKRSMQVSLVLLGTMALFGCSKSDTYQYANKDDCVKDWGETECENNGSYNSRTGGYFFYANSRRYSSMKAKNAVSVQRGGFGSRYSSGRS